MAQKRCVACKENFQILLCDGCCQPFCTIHLPEHKREFDQEMNKIKEQSDRLERELELQIITNDDISKKITRWEEESIWKIQSAAETARNDLKKLNQEWRNRFNTLMNQLSAKLQTSQHICQYIKAHRSRWMKQVEQLKAELHAGPNVVSSSNDSSTTIGLIRVKATEKTEKDQITSVSNAKIRSEDKPTMAAANSIPSLVDSIALKKPEPAPKPNLPLSPTNSFSSLILGLDQQSDPKIQLLFERLMSLQPMDKNGPMNGKCTIETVQMERFLQETFRFRNIPGRHIVQGVKSFRLSKPVHALDPSTKINFPKDSTDSFVMSVQEIIDWQRSYKVYADKNVKGMDKEFLQRALQGQSQDGEEAFRMKFVVRISTCPILMEFDAKVIPRQLNEYWPHQIKLVSVTGIDFAGRKHDIWDILYYISNWKDVFEVDYRTDLPALRNERDFGLRRGGPLGRLHEDRLLEDLTYMARLRLRACDREGVEIVVETGIGLGVFSGAHIGVDEKVRITSAVAIRSVLEEDGSSFQHIRAVVFALPIMNEEKNSGHARDAFSTFTEHFHEPPYKGRIPVLIADQDMHRLAVAIAREGFTVSELNPADSHAVFGEYWQNMGPAVEEKLALTTVGLLVQHHLVNPYVLDLTNYYLI